MKQLSVFLVLTLMSTVALAESDTFQYASYKEMFFHDVESGTYSYTTSCTDNRLLWDKTEKKYSRIIEKKTEKGFDIVQHNGDSVKITSNSVDSDGSKFFSESEITFLSENNYVRHNKSQTFYADGTEYKMDRTIEGSYIDGKFNVAKTVSNGVEIPVKKSTAITVVNDNRFNSYYDVYSFEPANTKERMEDPSTVNFTLKVDTVCSTQYTKL